MRQPLSGVVSFLLTDVEGSTDFWERDEGGMDIALAAHDAVMRAAIDTHGGSIFSTAGDSFAAAFATPLQAVSAAVTAQRGLRETGLRVRMAVHVGEAHERDGDYFGPTVNRAARLMAAAHGAQVLVSNAVAELMGEPIQLRDLGEHRLRDLSSTMRIWQVVDEGLEAEFPPLRTLDGGRSNLPLQRTSLVGRDIEIDALAAALGEASMVTVTGVGGIGKTRVALHTAARVLPGFPGGVWWAALAGVERGGAVADVVLAAVGGRRQAGRSPLATLADQAGGRRLLVVLDNCEHVLGAAAECAEAIVAGGRSMVLATSRQPLAVDGERVFPLPSLPAEAAVALFGERARAVDPSFSVDGPNGMVVAEICRRLDGMPLALELAAARVRSMTIPDIARRLDARFRLLRGGDAVVARQRTLQASIQWSYDLLDPQGRDLFARLSVFAGGFSAVAVAAVCGDVGMDDIDAADVLDTLVGRSMIAADRSGPTTRYSLLETLRQFGEDRLGDSGEAVTIRGRHARHLLGVAEEARRQLSSPEAAAAMGIVESEWDNLRVAFDWFASTADIDGALRLIVAGQWFATLSSHYELLPWAERAISLDGATEHELWPAAAGATATLRVSTGDLSGAQSLALEALRVEAVQGRRPRFEPASALVLACWISGQTDQSIKALPALERMADESQDPLELAWARIRRAMIYLVTDLAGVGSFADDAVRYAEATGNPHQLAFAYTGLVAIAAGRKDAAEARAAFEQVSRWAHVANNRIALPLAQSFLAMAFSEDEPLEALTLIREVLATYDDTGQWQNLDMALRRIILPLLRLGRDQSAALLLGALPGLTTANPDTQQVVPRATAALIDILGADLDSLLQKGRSLTRHELVRFALQEIDLCLRAP